MYEKILTGYWMIYKDITRIFMYEHGTMTTLFNKSFFLLLETHTQIFMDGI